MSKKTFRRFWVAGVRTHGAMNAFRDQLETTKRKDSLVGDPPVPPPWSDAVVAQGQLTGSEDGKSRFTALCLVS